jgi:hypothetical protein
LPVAGKELTVALKRWIQQVGRQDFLESVVRFPDRGRAIPELVLRRILQVWRYAD